MTNGRLKPMTLIFVRQELASDLNLENIIYEFKHQQYVASSLPLIIW